jgi:hypothetical protein
MNDHTDPGKRRLRDALGLDPDGRRIFHWRGKNREQDIAALADVIAAAVEIYNQNEQFVQLGPTGQLIPVNLASLRELIGKHIAGMRVVVSNGVGRKEYFSYSFDPAARPGPPRWEDHGRGAVIATEPDDKALRQIYTDELLWRIPRVES